MTYQVRSMIRRWSGAREDEVAVRLFESEQDAQRYREALEADGETYHRREIVVEPADVVPAGSDVGLVAVHRCEAVEPLEPRGCSARELRTAHRVPAVDVARVMGSAAGERSGVDETYPAVAWCEVWGTDPDAVERRYQELRAEMHQTVRSHRASARTSAG